MGGGRESAGEDCQSDARRYALPPTRTKSTKGARNSTVQRRVDCCQSLWSQRFSETTRIIPRPEIKGISCIQRPYKSTFSMGYNLQKRLDAFVSGECSLGVFVEELFVLCSARPESAWDVLSLIDQYYRRGKLPADPFRTIKYRIEQHVLGVPDSDTVRELPGCPAATEALVGAARGGAIAVVTTHERAASPKLASEVRALRIQLPHARRSAHRFRKRVAILTEFARRTRSALANTRRELGVGGGHARDYCERLTSIEWRRFVREHIKGEFIGPCVVWAVLAALLLAIDSSPLPQDLPKHRDRGNVIPSTAAAAAAAAAAAVVIPQISDPGQISLSADRYVVFPGHASAEIEVHRSPGVNGDVSFVWWTQRSVGTEPGRDYVSRVPTKAHFSDGEDTLYLSVPIVPNPSRKHTELFYVVIGEPSGGASLGSTRRATVFILRPDVIARRSSQVLASAIPE